MVGIVLVGHCNLAGELHNVVKAIVGEVEGICPVYFEGNESPEVSIKKVSEAIEKVDDGSDIKINVNTIEVNHALGPEAFRIHAESIKDIGTLGKEQ